MKSLVLISDLSRASEASADDDCERLLIDLEYLAHDRHNRST